MAHILKYEEWQGAGDMWHCGDITELGTSIAGKWWIPARMLGISPADYIKLVHDRFHPDRWFINIEKKFVSFSWKNQADCRNFKNWLNAEARKRSFIV